MNQIKPSFADIEQAEQRLADHVMNTPCLPSRTLSRLAGCELFLKFENLQFTASFKERGALNKLLGLGPKQRGLGVVAMSAGNHAQGVAYHAARLGIAATIVMPVGTPLTKISRTRDHGARVIVEGANLAESHALAEQLVEQRGLTLVHPYDDVEVIAGQGTLGLEIVRAIENLDVIVVPIGGGGLIAGVAIAAKAINPDLQVIGVQSVIYPSMVRAVAGDDAPVPDGVTIAEGIAVKRAGALTRQFVSALVDDILLVEEASIERAIALLQSVEKTVCEGAGAAGLAAVLEHGSRFRGKRVAVPLTGGNIDSRMFANVILRDQIRQGSLMRLDVTISDQPGMLADIATLLGREGACIVEVGHDRMALSVNPKRVSLELLVEIQDRAHGDRLMEALRANRYEVARRALN
ncbi:threonine ammonia-lyase [Sphingomonas sp.]|uniref:threonine ammonia-lyase n=1 Tax=Sphingomonas sp. TaxID=28214 RepID=UPI003BA8AE5B